MSAFTDVMHAPHRKLSFWQQYIFPLDHQVIAMQYLFTGMLMALVGGNFAYVFQVQLAFPGTEVPGFGVVTPVDYNALVTNHGSIMIFGVAMPVLITALERKHPDPGIRVTMLL
ncbi:MAG: cbb3-type cytochrome c oxidase subunit I [Candidatus Entotheonellia bacterium]